MSTIKTLGLAIGIAFAASSFAFASRATFQPMRQQVAAQGRIKTV
jgi:hypothetical protein